MRRVFILPLLSLALATGARAQDAEPTSAEEANASPARPVKLSELLAIAVRQNPTLELTAVDIAIAEADVIAAKGLDDWLLFGNLGVNQFHNETVAGEPFQTTDSRSINAGLGVSRGLSTGGTLSVSASSTYAERDFQIIDPNDPLSGDLIDSSSGTLSGGVSINYEQPLLRGFGSKVARIAQRQAAVGKDIATIAREVAAIDVVRQIIDAYWELAYATEVLAIRRNSVELALEQLRITDAAIKGGAAAPTARLAVEQAIAVREEAVLLAEVEWSERSLELRRLVGLEIGPGEINLRAVDELEIAERKFDLDKVLARAFERNPTLALYGLQEKGALLEVEIAVDGVRPNLDLQIEGGPTGSSDEPGETFNQIGTFKAYTASATLVYTQVLGNNAAEGREMRARANVRKVKLSYEEARQEIAVSVVRAVNLVRAARKRITVSKKAIELAEQNVEVERKRFLAGRATNFDVLQRLDELQQAQLNHARAQVDYRKAIVLVESLTGDLLGGYGIDVQRD